MKDNVNIEAQAFRVQPLGCSWQVAHHKQPKG
jgi:hypothetical protein